MCAAHGVLRPVHRPAPSRCLCRSGDVLHDVLPLSRRLLLLSASPLPGVPARVGMVQPPPLHFVEAVAKALYGRKIFEAE